MTTNIGYLAPGMDGHVVGLGIERRGLRKTWGKSLEFFQVHSHSIVDSVAKALPNFTIG
jgi:hypothetical protein